MKVEWDGVGMPPIGIEFEMSYRNNNDWKKCVLIAHGEEQIIYKYDGKLEFSGHRSNYQFRPIPIRSEADKKRKETINLMDKRFKEVLAAGSTEAMAIFATVYDTVAAGEIPGTNVE